MAVEKKQPLQSSTAYNSTPGGGGAAPVPKKTIEEVYQKKTQLEHILLRPDTYIGSVEKHTQTLWVYENGEMVHRPVTYVPGLYKIFDEILVNAADNKQRDPSMDSVKVEIDVAGNCISVYNNGDGIPVEIHQEEGVYVPEMIFGHLLTSSNYDDNVKKTTGGRNGYGAKLSNIFSTEFVIQTADGRRQKKYKQVFSENMGKKSEPSIVKCKEGENWTKVTFKPDLAKFNMTHLEDDVVALMKKRVVDLAGILGKSIKVELNGQRIPVKSFSDYVNLYLQSASKSRPEPLPRILEKVNDRWEICVSLSEGQFQQVSFVNGIATVKGGTHVEYVTNQITSHLMNIVNKKNKNANLKAHNVRSHLWVFVNALINNPAFDSQTKETLTTRQGSFGSKCELSQEFLKKVAKSGVVNSLLSWADFKQSKELKKTDGTKRQRIVGIPKLEDANDAGGRNSEKCTLILTEGDSAKALAMAGISVVGRNHYGVFPLRGKLLNVREASHKQIMENAEIQNIKQILGLQQGKEYESTKGLRYGHLMIMTDQDHDGSHIKGLLINFVHSFWPSLLKIPSFMVEFITPIVKATHNRNKNVLSFYSMPEYEAWKESLGGNASSWSIKYYKGLGTSTSKEGKEYFQDIHKHKKDFMWVDEQDGDAIELAFSKKKIEARKNWLRQFEPGTYLDQREKLIKYSDFVNKELILFSMADLQRSIPSMVDGLKPGQRKILFCSFKRNFVKEAKVAQFSGYVSEHSAYHHGEQSLASTIIGMAQDFVGSNNINLLQPNGQFGTRHQGGKDHASARYIYTRLSPLTRFLFPKDDDILLDYLNEDGQSIEPTWYMPIIPMVLVNGSEGIGTGWSSFVPNYNPRDIVANVRRLLNGEPMQPMDPWYRGFKGLIEKSASKEAGVTYTVTGLSQEEDNTTLRITELPIRRWTQDYKEFLESMMTGNDKIKEPLIKDYREQNDDVSVHFEIILTEEKLKMAREEGIEKKFKLTTTIGTTNMHLFDSKGVIKKYDTPEQILEDFFHLRLEFYGKRKKALLDNLELDLLKLDNKVRFILGVVRGEIIVNNRKRADLFLELQQKGFAPFPKKSKGIDAAIAGATVEEDGNEESPEVVNGGGAKATDYEYLLSMAIGTLTWEKVQELCAERKKLEDEVEELRKSSPRDLWTRDLDAFERELDEQERKDAEEGIKRETRMKNITGAAVSKQGPKKPRKNNANNSSTVSDVTSTDTGNAPEASKPKPRGRTKKAPAKKAAVVESDEDEEVLALKDRLAAYNLDSSPDQSAAMETEAVLSQHEQRKKEPSKRTTARKAPSTTFTEISDGDDAEDDIPTILEDDDEDFELVEEVPKKPANVKARGGKAGTTTTRKRGAAQSKPVLSQKLITRVLKPVESAGISPEKKVRKMRASPFNKKSGSVVSRIGSEDSGSSSPGNLAELNEVPAAAARPKRENRRRTVYIESDSDVEDEPAADDDSDFEEEED
ncbi:DNA topoisomerase 2-like [Phoenix dactylifera]|uniref:DNA topoisomerase 2 n=1 Tax=Phoenix dactylifera TaxID=42345 RepID=A0A8B8ZRV7_PHODC|nr:DNA topoisomerase 2-like [Phoenix dactylifera]